MRAKAIPPQIYREQEVDYLMPKDPDGGGTWLVANQFGFVFVLLNNYQGTVKRNTEQLISRGKILTRLAVCQTKHEVQSCLNRLSLESYQAFSLLCISEQFKAMWLHYGDNRLVFKALPNHWFSSAHPNSKQVIKERIELTDTWPVNCDADLLQLHRSHLPNNHEEAFEDRTYSICMHHEKGQSQSLTYVKLYSDKIIVDYFDGQPCQTNESLTSELAITGLS